jgi:leader peptidase (prepilin peptidase) / N-methyltransferase
LSSVQCISKAFPGHHQGNALIWLNQISLELRTAIVFLLGIGIATQINRAIYAWAHFHRPIGPWSKPHPDAPRRKWSDYLPIIGWVGMRRENAIHGPWHWVRPLWIEILFPMALAGLYWSTLNQAVHNGAVLLPKVIPLPAADPTLHLQFLSHAILFALMLIATFIDFDEQTIPDEVTVPGALLGLILAGAAPWSTLLTTNIQVAAVNQLLPLQFSTPKAFPASMEGPLGLLAGVTCFLAWCVSVLPLLFMVGWGWQRWKSLRAVKVFWGLTLRDRQSKRVFAIGAIGTLGIIAAWWFGSGTLYWQSLFSSLVGLVFGGALVWAVRIVGTWAMRQEAMGFGDVMLMAMIGAFLGWQGVLITFFLAPAAALVIAVLQRVLTGRGDIAFGPYLCVAAAAVVVMWPYWWEERNLRDLFNLGWTIVWIVAGCVALMGIMLWLLRLYRELGGDKEEAAE